MKHVKFCFGFIISCVLLFSIILFFDESCHSETPTFYVNGQYICHLTYNMGYHADCQTIVDQEDMALWQKTYDNTWVICDHVNQEFGFIKNLTTDDVITINDGRGTRYYYAVLEVGTGYRDDDKCSIVYNGYDVWHGKYEIYDNANLILFTCRGVNDEIYYNGYPAQTVVVLNLIGIDYD